jgi:hypothetical protein
MKLLILFFIALTVGACTKPADVIQTTEKKKVFYRIKQVDKDGNETYSPTVYVIEETKK